MGGLGIGGSKNIFMFIVMKISMTTYLFKFLSTFINYVRNRIVFLLILMEKVK